MGNLKKMVLLSMSVLALAACGSDTGAEEKTTEATSSSSPEATSSAASETPKETTSNSKATYADRTLTAEEATLKITGFEKSTDYDGQPMFYVFFDLTNNGKL